MADQFTAYMDVDTVGIGRQKRLEQIKEEIESIEGVENVEVILAP